MADIGHRSRYSLDQDCDLQTSQSCHKTRGCEDSPVGDAPSACQSSCILETISRCCHRGLEELHRRFRQGRPQIRIEDRTGRCRTCDCARSPGRGKESCHQGGIEGPGGDHRRRGGHYRSHLPIQPSHERRPLGYAGWPGETSGTHRGSRRPERRCLCALARVMPLVDYTTRNCGSTSTFLLADLITENSFSRLRTSKFCIGIPEHFW